MNQHHVVIVGRAGEHPDSNIYMTEVGSKRDAIHTGETEYRKTRKLASNIQLVSQVVYSGEVEECELFIDRLEKIMDEKAENKCVFCPLDATFSDGNEHWCDTHKPSDEDVEKFDIRPIN